MDVVTEVDLTKENPIKTGGYISLELSAILAAVCEVNEVNVFNVKGKRRFRNLVTARREYCYLACKLTQLTERNPLGKSLSVIGSEVNISYCDVLYHKKIVLNWFKIKGYKMEEKFNEIINLLKL